MFASAPIVGLLHGATVAFAGQYDCLIEPYQSLEIGSAVTGVLEKVWVKRGDHVSRGQILFTLESSAEVQAVELARLKSQALGPTRVAEVTMEFGQRKFERYRGLAQESLVPERDVDEAESEWRLAQADWINAKESKEQAAVEHKQ